MLSTKLVSGSLANKPVKCTLGLIWAKAPKNKTANPIIKKVMQPIKRNREGFEFNDIFLDIEKYN